MPDWTPATPWRQGHVIPLDAAAALDLTAQYGNDTRAVVIGHDCDLVVSDLETEPDVEIIIGRVVPKADGNFAWGKSPRTLHLAVTIDGAESTIELVATNKARVHKGDLARFAPDVAHSLAPEDAAVLRKWLGARYDRAAFPDEFVRRMKATRFAERLARVLEPRGALVSFVFFNIDDGVFVERPKTETYALTIAVVYRGGTDPESAADDADEVVAAIEAECEKRFVPAGESKIAPIVLRGCLAISEDDFPLSRARTVMPWRLEHMTLKAGGDDVGMLGG